MTHKIGDVSKEVTTQNDIVMKLIEMVEERDTLLNSIYKPQVLTMPSCKYCENHKLDNYLLKDPDSDKDVYFKYCPRCGREL